MRRIIILLLLLATAAAIDYTWLGGDGAWETPTNWSPTGVPSTDADKAIFNAGAPAVITTAPVTIGELDMQAGFSGTLTLGGNIDIVDLGPHPGYLRISGGTVDANGFGMHIDQCTIIATGATLLCGSGNHQFGDPSFADVTNFALFVEGTFDGGSGDHSVATAEVHFGNVKLTSGTTDFTSISWGYTLRFWGGTFDHNGGTVKFSKQGQQTLYNVYRSEIHFYNLVVEKGANNVLQYYLSYGFPLVVDNNLQIISGTFSTAESGGGVSRPLTVVGQTSITGGTLTCNDAAVSLGTGYTAGYSLYVLGGTFDGGSGTHSIGSTLNYGGVTLSSGTTTFTIKQGGSGATLYTCCGAGTAIDPNGGTVEITTDGANLMLFSDPDQRFHNLIINKPSGTMRFHSGNSFTVDNDFTIQSGTFSTLDNSANSKDIGVTGNLDVQANGILAVNDAAMTVGGTLTETGTITFGGGSIEKQWAADVNVKGEGSNLEGASVSFENQQSETVDLGTTDANGDYSTLLSEWSMASGGTTTLEPYSVTADDIGFAGESQEMPLTAPASLSFDLSTAGDSGIVAPGEVGTWVDIGASFMVNSDAAGTFVIESVTQSQAEATCGASLPADYTFDYLFDMSCPGAATDISVSPSDGIATRWWHCEAGAWVDVTDGGVARVTSCSPFAGAATSGGTVYTAPALEMLDIAILLALAAIVAIGAIYRRK